MPKWLVVTLLFVTAGLALFWYFARVMQQPVSGEVVTTLSPRAADYESAPSPDVSTQSATTDCFTLTMPVPVTNLKTSAEMTDYSSECVVRGSIAQPNAQFTISSSTAPNLGVIQEDPGVRLRMQDEQYSSITINALASFEYRAFSSKTELTAFWIDSGRMYVVSLHSAARVTDELQAVHAKFIEQMVPATTNN